MDTKLYQFCYDYTGLTPEQTKRADAWFDQQAVVPEMDTVTQQCLAAKYAQEFEWSNPPTAEEYAAYTELLAVFGAVPEPIECCGTKDGV
jgi:hypothetical protein